MNKELTFLDKYVSLSIFSDQEEISLPQLFHLLYLGDHKHYSKDIGVPIGKIAEDLNQKLPSTSGYLSNLMRSRMVEKKIYPESQRERYVRLTRLGERMYDSIVDLLK